MRFGTVAGVALVLAIPAQTGLAETANPALALAPAGDRALLVGGADARGAATFRARVAFDYASRPVSVLAPDQSEYSVVAEQAWVSFGASFALSQRVLFALELPLLAAQSGEQPDAATLPLAPASDGGLGDVRVLARARLLGAAD